MVAAAPAMGNLLPSALLLPWGAALPQWEDFCVLQPMNAHSSHTDSTVNSTSPFGQRNNLVCPAKQHRCQAAAVPTSTRFVLRTSGPALFKQPVRKTSEMGFVMHLMSA